MSPAFEKALAARLLWINVKALEGLEGCEEQHEQAINTAYEAVHALVTHEILVEEHYGPRAPLLLVDAPELADQYNLAYEVTSQVYYTNYHNAEPGDPILNSPKPDEPLAVPYTQWLGAVTREAAKRMGVTCTRAHVITKDIGSVIQESWTWGLSAAETASAANGAYTALLCSLTEGELAEYQADVDQEQRALATSIIAHYRAGRPIHKNQAEQDQVESQLVEHWLCDCQSHATLAP